MKTYKKITNVDNPDIRIGAILVMVMDNDYPPNAFDSSIIIDINRVTDTHRPDHPKYDDQITLARPHMTVFDNEDDTFTPYVSCEIYKIERSKLRHYALEYINWEHTEVAISIYNQKSIDRSDLMRELFSHYIKVPIG